MTNFKFFILTFCLFATSVMQISADQMEDFLRSSEEMNPSMQLTAKKYESPNQKKASTSMHFSSTNCIEASNYFFFNANIGAGFLYFSGIDANLMGQPVLNFLNPKQFTSSEFFRDAPFKGRLSYNKTPLFEYQLGTKLLPWLKAGLSYQYQGALTVQTKALSAYPWVDPVAPSFKSYAQFTANLSLNALLFKLDFVLPYSLIIQNLALNPHLSVGIGAGWQSWTRVNVNFVDTFDFNSINLPLKQKISANAVWMLDAGFSLQPLKSKDRFSLNLGCKYNQWGQARSIGAMVDQGQNKRAISDPFRIKTVYQFAPYLGGTWIFPNTSVSKSPNTLGGHHTNRWKPFLLNNKQLQNSSGMWTQFNAGIGFLYFSGASGNLMGKPQNYFSKLADAFADVPLKGRLNYNRTPLFEYLIGYSFSYGLKFALSYQYQTGVTVETDYLNAFANPIYPANRVQFSSNLMLNALLLKIYYDLPSSIIFKNLALTPYFSAGVGPGWQTWSHLGVSYMSHASFSEGMDLNLLNLRQKISANAVWMIDVGFKLQKAAVNRDFSVTVGCKYNEWGQARNIGKMSQQGTNKKSLVDPLRIKTVYQFSPYLGLNWNFSSSFVAKSPISFDGKKANRWKPFWTHSKNLINTSQLWVQFNAGVGFLYFSGLDGELTVKPPGTNITRFTTKSTPVECRLSYNRTPLFEYLVGYRFNSWLKLALSYQHQSGITVQTKPIKTFVPNLQSQYAQLTSNLNLDALLAKIYFESPFALICKNIATTPYLAFGIGPGWQSWTRIYNSNNYTDSFNQFLSKDLNLKQKISANAVWMIDAGFMIQGARLNSPFAVTLGCKYNEWGQARNIGKMSQQSDFKASLSKPFRIKTVYQFAPYLGLNWNF